MILKWKLKDWENLCSELGSGDAKTIFDTIEELRPYHDDLFEDQSRHVEALNNPPPRPNGEIIETEWGTFRHGIDDGWDFSPEEWEDLWKRGPGRTRPNVGVNGVPLKALFACMPKMLKALPQWPTFAKDDSKQSEVTNDSAELCLAMAQNLGPYDIKNVVSAISKTKRRG